MVEVVGGVVDVGAAVDVVGEADAEEEADVVSRPRHLLILRF